jgi:multidrug efflux pump subunit AcrA (membrane-fusion protein)
MVEVTTGSVTESVTASGTLEPDDTADLSFGASGTVKSVSVAAGDTVKAGQVLATEDKTSLDASLESAEAQLESAEDKLAQDEVGSVSATQITQARSSLATAKSALSAAKVKVATEKAALAKAEKAAGTTATTSSSSEAAASSTTSGSSAVSSDQSSLTQDEQAVTSDENSVTQDAQAVASDETPQSAATVASDKAAVATAEASVASATTDVSEATLVAPFAGTVEAVNITAGDTAGSSGSGSAGTGSSSSSTTDSSSSSSSSTADIELISSDKFEVVVDVDASDISSVKTGDTAAVTLSGVTQPVTGTVTAISKVASVSDGVATIPVTVAISGDPSGLYSGVSADVTITTFDKANVLVLPTAAVHTDGTSSYVYVLSAGNEARKAVTVGSQGSDTTQITSGLTSGEEVVETVVTATVPGTSTNGTTGSSTTRTFGGTGTFGGGSFGGGAPSGGSFGGRG